MKTELSKYMSMYQGLDLTPFELESEPDYEIDETPFASIIKEVFSIDADTGLPKGDLAYWLSPDGNPQIKQWLENNLLKPRSVRSGTSIDGVTDDLMIEMSRGADESFESYASRLASIRDEVIYNSGQL